MGKMNELTKNLNRHMVRFIAEGDLIQIKVEAIKYLKSIGFKNEDINFSINNVGGLDKK